MKLTLRKCESLTDWYVIERAEAHGEHREWMEKAPGAGYTRFMTSARLSDADVEGNAREMLSLAESILARTDESHKRCAVEFRDGVAYFTSPRNTNDAPAAVPLADADDIAALIVSTLAPVSS